MKRFILPLPLLLALAGLSGCGPSAEDMSKRYGKYPAAEKGVNKAGFSISKVDTTGANYTVQVFFSSPALNQSKENNDAMVGRLRVFSAEKPGETVAFQHASGTSTTTRPNGSKSQHFFPAVFIKEPKERFVLLYFKGISKSEVPNLETPPLFHVIDLDKKKPRALTEKPLLAGDLFQ